MSDDITWTCLKCQFPIADGEGYVQANMGVVYGEHMDALAEWKTTYEPDGKVGHTAAELMAYPDPVPWQPLHSACDESGGAPYCIDVQELRNAWGLVHWTAHLMQKSWLGSTNWNEVLRAVHGARNY